MTDTRFPTALQMLLTLANAERAGVALVSSARLAYGVGTTASLIRRLLVALGREGLVVASLGKNGGVRLARPAERIALGEIYRAVVGDKTLLVARKDVPHRCDVSSNVEAYFESLAADAEAAVVAMLDTRTLAQTLDEVLARKRAPSTRRGRLATRGLPG